jgi:N-acyl-D-amino-acid deacylase
MFSLLLRNGTVIDGTGAARRHADVALNGDRIAAVDRLEGATAERVIDAAGLIVAPGFVDVHNHSDGWLLKIPHLVSKTLQGFTTEIIASDGISYAPVTKDTARDWIYYLRSLNGLELADYRGWETMADYMALLDRRTAQNVAVQTPYANVRVLAKDWDAGVPDDTQMRHMQREVEIAMEQGCVGVSTGMDYVSQCFSKTDEIAEVCQVLRRWQGIYVTHVRYKKGTLQGVQEAVEIGRRCGIPVHISHMKCDSAEASAELLDYVDRVAVREVDFSFDVYPYLPGSTMLNFFLPNEVWVDGPLHVLPKLKSPAVRRRLQAFLDHPSRPKLDKCYIAWVSSKTNSRFQGKTLQDYVDYTGLSPADALCDLLIAENLAVLLVVHVGNDSMIEPFLAHPKYMMGTDGIFFADGATHPRQYGSAARVLGPMVRDRRLFTLEAAVRKLSGYPAERFGLKDRGVVRPGAFADITVFDPATIADRATYTDSQQTSIGMRHVLVNGVPVIADGVPVEGLEKNWPGRVLKFKQ